MERTERYDPEDLEQMMLERSFDELLEEERAFALRHLESRAEYERMRILLHHMQQSTGNTPVPEADPRVREHVLAAFRAQQQPQWRIWLNSVGAFLFPQRPALYWRPALALGTVAVLTVTVLMTYQAFESEGNKQLAEVKTLEQAEPAPPKPMVQSESAGTNDVSNTRTTPASSTEVDAPVKEPEQLAATKAAVPVQEARTDVSVESKSLQEPVEQEHTSAASGLATTTTLQDEMMKVEQAAPATAMDMAENRNKEAEETASRKRSAFAEESADKAAAPAYSEYDLLGLLQAAW